MANCKLVPASRRRNFIFPGVVHPFQFSKHGARITGAQHQNVLVIRIHRRISRKLWEDVKYFKQSGFHMSTLSALFCLKAIGTVYYLIYRYSGNRTINRHVYTLHMQFKVQCEALGEYNRDLIANLFRPDTSNKPMIDSNEALERAMFSSLRYTERDKQSISR